MNFNPQSIPTTLIPLNSLKEAIEIKHWLKGFQRICYAIVHTPKKGQNEVLKYGQSAHQTDGERIYRQIWRIPGWPTSPASYSAGDDFDWVVEQRPDLQKKDVVVMVYDMRSVPMVFSLRPEFETIVMESWLIESYYKTFGRCPIGNKTEQQRLEKGLDICPKKSVVIGKIYSHLFETD
jgi:hypothetical protein